MTPCALALNPPPPTQTPILGLDSSSEAALRRLSRLFLSRRNASSGSRAEPVRSSGRGPSRNSGGKPACSRRLSGASQPSPAFKTARQGIGGIILEKLVLRHRQASCGNAPTGHLTTNLRPKAWNARLRPWIKHLKGFDSLIDNLAYYSYIRFSLFPPVWHRYLLFLKTQQKGGAHGIL